MQTIGRKLISRIYGSSRGWVFTPDDFRDLGDPRSVGMALSRLVAKGTIRRLARGLYDYPKTHSELGVLLPSPDAIAKALAGKHHIRLQPSGAYAANLLGLSEQVPSRVVFLTDGESRRVVISRLTIELKKTTPKNMVTAGRVSGLVIQALRHLGQKHIEADRVQKLKEQLSPEDKRQLIKDVAYAPAWMRQVFRAIAGE